MMNLQVLLLMFCEPFMDASYSKVGLAMVFVHRLGANAPACRWTALIQLTTHTPRESTSMTRLVSMRRTTRLSSGARNSRLRPVCILVRSFGFKLTDLPFFLAPPNFITEIFYLTLAASHIGQQKIVNNVEELSRQYDEIRRHLETLNGDQSWRGTPFQARTEAAINAAKVGLHERTLPECRLTVYAGATGCVICGADGL